MSASQAPVLLLVAVIVLIVAIWSLFMAVRFAGVLMVVVGGKEGGREVVAIIVVPASHSLRVITSQINK